jgi:hypothetical protein
LGRIASVSRDAEIVTELTNRVDAEMPMLPEHLRMWFESHRARPQELTVSSDSEGTHSYRVWLVTDDIGDRDGSSRVVYDAERKKFGLLMELQNGVLWYMGSYGSLEDTIQAI